MKTTLILLLTLPFLIKAQSIQDNVSLNKDFVMLLNEYRRQNGLDPVVLDDATIYRAKLQAEYCAEIKDLTHDCPNWFPLRWAENALWNGGSDARGCLEQWIESSGHNENLLLDGATRIGIYGVEGYYDGDWGYYAVLVIN
jgi:uncharacterized protein YkwD